MPPASYTYIRYTGQKNVSSSILCDFLSPNVNCIFRIDAGRAFKYVLCYDTGTIWCLDDPNQFALYCIPKCITQDNVYARVLKRVVIKAQSFTPIEVGTHNSMPPQEWCSQVLSTCTDSLWTEFGATVLQGLDDFSKGPTTLCIISTTPPDLILKSGQIVANLSPIELQHSNTNPILGYKSGDSCDVNQLHSLFQDTFNGSKRIDNHLPTSLSNIVPADHSRGFTFKEHDKRINIFKLKLKADYTVGTDEDDADDADIISCPLATHRSKPLGKGVLPETIEKLLTKCNDTLNEDQMKVAHEKIYCLWCKQNFMFTHLWKRS